MASPWYSPYWYSNYFSHPYWYAPDGYTPPVDDADTVCVYPRSVPDGLLAKMCQDALIPAHDRNTKESRSSVTVIGQRTNMQLIACDPARIVIPSVSQRPEGDIIVTRNKSDIVDRLSSERIIIRDDGLVEKRKLEDIIQTHPQLCRGTGNE